MTTATLAEYVTDRLTVNQIARRENVHCASVWRWMQHGVRGIRLHAIRVGGRRFVTEADWLEFAAKLNADLIDTPQTPPRSEGRRRKDSDAARDALRRAGV